jgi:RNA polymerase sigma-70 factor (ECF subfamily)
MDDQQLYHIIEQCKKGDHKAQVELYRRFYRNMYNVSFRILNHSAEAEDAMQEAFIAAFKQLDRFRGEVSFGNWLKRIVINRSIDLLRKKKMHLEDLSKLSHRTDDEPAEFENDISIEMVKAAIANLPDNYRVVLSLFLIEGYDHEEIAEIMKISNGSSRIIYHRAKEKLKMLLMEMKKAELKFENRN